MRVLLLYIAAAAWLYAADLTVVVHGLENSDGKVFVGLFDAPEGFPKTEYAFTGKAVEIDAAAAHCTFDGLKDGSYAVAVFHDENGNGKFDRNFIGMPKEGYGFSNHARASFGPPSFAQARFALEGNRTITIEMAY